MTDWRALCEELLEAWTVELGELSDGNRLCKRARAALAADHEAAMDDLRQVSREIGEAQADIFRAALADIEVTASELADLMQGVLDGDYRPDSFTLQPIAASLGRVRAALALETVEAND